MPPSPLMKRSPIGDPPGDSHRRERSLESGLSFKETDDDLALFNEMQSREKESFLLGSTDDLEDLLFAPSEKMLFPDIKLGINIPARGESSDLLNADVDKNDYEWLITPPDTPIFRSLDDLPATTNLVHSGRARSRPISFSRSSTMDKSHRSSKGSPSPQRLSPSPRSGNSNFQGRPSSAPRSNLALRPSTPSGMLSPPPVKPSTPPSRSLTPTSRKTSVGSTGSVALSGVRRISPAKTSRGNSASPKIRAWQSNIPGFSLEAPPNLRTSLADRPASYIRGSSPASRSSRDSSSKFGRQSMSPTISRSISSSHSQERERLSSHSRASIASSADDDADSLQSLPVSIFDCPSSRKGVGGYPSGGPSAFSKKPTKTFSPSSAPKRSFDSAVRQMDRKSPQNMFRPLLSSVPSSTFYSGKSSLTSCTMISRNSSVTTSSNASSDLPTSGANDREDDMASDCARATFYDIHQEVFSFDKMDTGSEDTGQGQVVSSVAQPDEPDEACAFASYPGDIEESESQVISIDPVDVQGDLDLLDKCEKALVCSACGSHYHPINLDEDNICPECKRLKLLRSSGVLTGLGTAQCVSVPLVDPSEKSDVKLTLLDGSQLIAVGDTQSTEALQMDLLKVYTAETQHHVSYPSQSCLDYSPSVSLVEDVDVLSEQQVTREHRSLSDPSNTTCGSLELLKHYDNSSLNMHVAEGAGISVLLNRSSSIKGPIVHGKTINSSAISFEDLSYARDLASSMRSSSVGHGSISTSSSIDLTSARHGESIVRRQLSGKLSDLRSKPLATVSSSSETSIPIYQGYGLLTSSREGSIEGSVINIWHNAAGERAASPSDQGVGFENGEANLAVPSDCGTWVTGVDKNDILLDSGEKNHPLVAEDIFNIEGEDNSRVSVGLDQYHVTEAHTKNVVESVVADYSLTEEIRVSGSRSVQEEVLHNRPQCSLSMMSEIEINDSHPSSPRSQIDVVPKEDLENLSADSTADDKDFSLKPGWSDHAVGIVEESSVTVEDLGEWRTRTLTLEEATDTILFCSSIIHDLAYKAATLSIEKEKENLEPLEGLRPTVTIPDKSSSDRQDTRGSSTKRTPKMKLKKKQAAETEAKPPLAQTDAKPNVPVVRSVGLPNNNDSLKPPKLESKCNCTIM